jgi:hypothetical protein
MNLIAVYLCGSGLKVKLATKKILSPCNLCNPSNKIVIFGFPGHSKFLQVIRFLQTTSVTYPSLKTRSDASFYVHFKNVAPATYVTRQTKSSFFASRGTQNFYRFFGFYRPRALHISHLKPAQTPPSTCILKMLPLKLMQPVKQNRQFLLPGALKILIGFSASTDHERYISVT